MWGVGLSELAVIAFVAVLVFGPDRLPVLAKQAGQWLKVARRFAHQARDELRSVNGQIEFVLRRALQETDRLKPTADEDPAEESG